MNYKLLSLTADCMNEGQNMVSAAAKSVFDARKTVAAAADIKNCVRNMVASTADSVFCPKNMLSAVDASDFDMRNMESAVAASDFGGRKTVAAADDSDFDAVAWSPQPMTAFRTFPACNPAHWSVRCGLREHVAARILPDCRAWRRSKVSAQRVFDVRRDGRIERQRPRPVRGESAGKRLK
jgi:hypothetical protein